MDGKVPLGLRKWNTGGSVWMEKYRRNRENGIWVVVFGRKSTAGIEKTKTER